MATALIAALVSTTVVLAASPRQMRVEVTAPPPGVVAPPPPRPAPRAGARCGGVHDVVRRAPRRDPFTSPVVLVPAPPPAALAPPASRHAPRRPRLRPTQADLPPAPSPVETSSRGAQIPETPAQPLPDRTLVVAGVGVPTAGLRRAQVRLLETLVRVPGLPTETLRRTRFVRFSGTLYRDDCSNVLRIPYAAQGIDLFSEHPRFPDANGVSLIEHKGAPVTAPEVGDLVLFDDTWDRNRNGARDDANTHAAIVIGFEPGGTVLLYNRVRSGHRVYRMNLRRPNLVRDPKTKARLNDYLRRRGADPKTPRLTGELFAGYVRVL